MLFRSILGATGMKAATLAKEWTEGPLVKANKSDAEVFNQDPLVLFRKFLLLSNITAQGIGVKLREQD